MAVFPPYEPDERSYDLGAHPVVTQRGWAGGAMRFRTGSVRVGAQLRLTFRRLVEANSRVSLSFAVSKVSVPVTVSPPAV